MFDVDTKTGEIWLYDEITPPGYGGIDAGSVVQAIKAIGKKHITVRFNSPGGDVDEGIAIYNALEKHPGGVTTVNDALAASISNYIYMVGEKRLAAENSRAMIHSPWTIAAGNATYLRKVSDILDQAEVILAERYQGKLGLSAEKVQRLMDAETWYNAKEAVSSGVSTEIGTEIDAVEPIKIAAKFGYKNTPTDLTLKLAAGAKNPYLPRLRKYKQLAAKVSAKHGERI